MAQKRAQFLSRRTLCTEGYHDSKSGDSQMGKRKSCMPLMSLSVPISRPVTVTRKARREGCMRNHSQTRSRDQGSCGVPRATWSSKGQDKSPHHLYRIWTKSHSLFIWQMSEMPFVPGLGFKMMSRTSDLLNIS